MLIALAGVQLLPLGLAVWRGEPSAAFVVSGLVALSVGAGMALGVRGRNIRIRPRDGFVIVSGAWIIAALFGAIPYWVGGHLGVIDSFFESTAGFTTTGSTALTDVEALPRSILLWRSLSSPHSPMTGMGKQSNGGGGGDCF